MEQKLFEMFVSLNAKLGQMYLEMGGARVAWANLSQKIPGPKDPFYTFLMQQSPQWADILNRTSLHDWGQAVNAALARYRTRVAAKEAQKSEYTPEEKILLKHLVVALEVSTGEEFVWDTQARRISDWTPSTFFRQFQKERRFALKDNCPLGRLVFDPYKGSTPTWTVEEYGRPVTVCNTYKPPQWQDREYNAEQMRGMKEEYPPFFNALMKMLFPVDAERAAVLDWLALALYDRPISYLSLRGIRGTGKSVFKLMVYHLIGNFYEAKENVLSEFNADLRHKRIICCDDNEPIGTRKGNTTRKHILNPTMSYNEKKVQTFKSERQYASLMILSNPSQAFYVESDERRIVSPTLGTVLMETWVDLKKPEVIAWLNHWEGMELTSKGHIAFVRQIGEALMVRYLRGVNKNLVLKGGHFWSDVVASLGAFKRYFVQSLIRPDVPETVEYEEIKADYKLNGSGGVVPQWHKLVPWVSEFCMEDVPVTNEELLNYEEKIVGITPEFRQYIMNKFKRSKTCT